MYVVVNVVYMQVGCAVSGPVCGMDGNSYESECSAWSASVPVDYLAPCTALPHSTDTRQ